MKRAVLGLLCFPLWGAAVSPADYAGAAACGACHPVESTAQSASAHAHALARAQYPQPGDWAFGAGTQAITFVRRLDSESYVEESQTWYRVLGGFARTPGHPGDAGVRDRIFDPSAAILRCFACHSTGPLRISGDQTIMPTELGVRCEVCHGPAAAHAREPLRIHPRNPGQLKAEDLNLLCGECHRMPAAAGQSLNLRDPWNARHQPLMLAESACFRESQGRLKCLTCHPPHATVSQKRGAYDAACMRCHSAPRHKLKTAGRPCVACHMPAVTAQPYLTFANHRIAVYAPADPMSPIRARR